MSVTDIVRIAALQTGVSIDEMRGMSRLRYIVEARHATTVVLRERAGMSYPHIAKVMNRADHTGVWYACNKQRTEAVKELVRDINSELDRIVSENRESSPPDASEQTNGVSGPLGTETR